MAPVYRYFAGKEAIVGALIEHFLVRTGRAFEAALAQHRDAKLEVALRAMLRALIERPG